MFKSYPCSIWLITFPRHLQEVDFCVSSFISVGDGELFVTNDGESCIFFPVNASQDLVEWFSVWTVWIRLPLLYVSPNKNVSKAGKVPVLCRLQWVSSRPLYKLVLFNAIFAWYVVQIVLVRLYWYFSGRSFIKIFIKFFFWHLLNSFVWSFIFEISKIQIQCKIW